MRSGALYTGKKSLALKNFIKYGSFCDSLSVLRHTRS